MLVSICIPTYNGSKFIAPAVRSALAQSGPLELVISDSGSSDDTLEIIRGECAGASIPVRILDGAMPGMVPNWNRLIEAARGDFVKFLFQDDLLHEGCIEKMLVPAAKNPRVGLVFSQRKLIIEACARATPVAEYLLKYADLHKGFKYLGPIQSGRSLIGDRKLLDEPVNKIGEPSAVMIRKDTALSAGLFNVKMRQLVDWEFWIRMMAKCDVAFADEALASFRVHGSQMSVENDQGSGHNLEEIELLRTLSSPGVFEHLGRSARVVVHRRAVASGIAISGVPSAIDRMHLALREVCYGGRRAFQKENLKTSQVPR